MEDLVIRIYVAQLVMYHSLELNLWIAAVQLPTLVRS